LAYTFSDTFWFSAVEGEVYATSSLFTAVSFWAILKWESATEDEHADRWIILIAYLVGLSIGVHLLNLLTIPAIVFVFYFKKYKTTKRGIICAFFVSLAILGFILFGFITWTVNFAAWFDLLFVNVFGLPFNSGALFYILLLLSGLVLLLRYTHKKEKVLMNKIVLAFAVMLIGYSSYVTIIIRASAGTPINLSDSKDAFSLKNYINRESYESRSLIFGPCYNAPITGMNSRYTYIPHNGKYIKSDLNPTYEYDNRFVSFFPRMASTDPNHIEAYKSWTDLKGEPVEVTNANGQTTTVIKPTFGENLKFFFKYQLGHMYFRYFMWNFSGRQDEIQGFGGALHGNWITGIPVIDQLKLGSQNKIPESLKSNRGRNIYFGLPFLLGIIGLIYHFKKHKKDFLVISLLFISTGIAIAIYLNEVPITPRERDYAVGGSFYVFCIWIGLGLLYLFELTKKKMSSKVALGLIFTLCLFLVPVLMAKENYDDHDRSNRYTARDFAFNCLNSCAPNAILFTNADNDTYPLWYAQEVEGIRRDVRIVLLPFLSADWYIEQLKRSNYEAKPIPMSIDSNKYSSGTLNYIPFVNRLNKAADLKEVIDFVGSDDSAAKIIMQDNSESNYVPTNSFLIPVDSEKVIKNGTVSPQFSKEILPSIQWNLKKRYLEKNDLVILDIIATNNWDRPIYFLSTEGPRDLGLEKYMRMDGFAYRLVPVKHDSNDMMSIGSVDTNILYDLLMNKYKWGNMNSPKVFMDYNNVRMVSVFGVRNCFVRLASELIAQKKINMAISVLDRCMEIAPQKAIPYDISMLQIIGTYYSAGAIKKAESYSNRFTKILKENIEYYNSLSDSQEVKYETQYDNYILQELERMRNI
jgi:hypothetical protein